MKEMFIFRYFGKLPSCVNLGYEDKTEQFFRDFDIDIYEDLNISVVLY